jgi:predicted nucleotidyltransferase
MERGASVNTVAISPQPPGSLIPAATVDQIVAAIVEKFSPQMIILFGSYVSGHPTPDSDLDLLVVMDTEMPRHKRAVPIRLLFRPMPCAMDIFVFTPAEVAEWNGTVNHIITEAFERGRKVYGK